MVRKRGSDAGKPKNRKQGNRSLKNVLKRLHNGIMSATTTLHMMSAVVHMIKDGSFALNAEEARNE